MKKFFAILFTVIALAAVFVVPVFALGLHQADAPVSAVQMYWVGLASLAIVYAVKLIATRFPKIKLTKEIVSVLIYVVALFLSLAFTGFSLPTYPAWTEPLSFVAAFFGFINALLVSMAPPVSLATLFYNLILKRVLDAGAVKAGLIEVPKTEPVLKAKK